jgi:polyprenyldihydroxybenzoate methyltransferase / 3-demethylubiquinol 3-O-methyltransferase
MNVLKRSVHRTARASLLHIRHRRCISSVNAEEVSHFDDLAATWWDPNGPSKLLHKMNLLRLQFINTLLPASQTSHPTQWLNGYSVLDIGCGGGILTESLARLGATTYAVDASSKAIEVAKKHLRTDPKLVENPPEYVCGSIEEHSLERKYDIVTAMEVLEHVDYPSSFLNRISEHVKPGGWLVVSTISRSWASWLGAIVASEKILRIVPEGTHSWEKFIKERELREFISNLTDDDGGKWATDMKSRGCVYNPLRGEWVFADGPGVFNYFFAGRRRV